MYLTHLSHQDEPFQFCSFVTISYTICFNFDFALFCLILYRDTCTIDSVQLSPSLSLYSMLITCVLTLLLCNVCCVVYQNPKKSQEMATSDSFIKQELKDLWAVKPIQFDPFYIHLLDSINRLLAKIPEKFAEEPLENGDNPGPILLDKTVNNAKEEDSSTSALQHLKSGDNKARAIKEHMSNNLGLSLEEVKKLKLNEADNHMGYITYELLNVI